MNGLSNWEYNDISKLLKFRGYLFLRSLKGSYVDRRLSLLRFAYANRRFFVYKKTKRGVLIPLHETSLSTKLF